MGRGASKAGGGGGFKEGATPKDIKLNASYNVSKTSANGRTRLIMV